MNFLYCKNIFYNNFIMFLFFYFFIYSFIYFLIFLMYKNKNVKF